MQEIGVYFHLPSIWCPVCAITLLYLLSGIEYNGHVFIILPGIYYMASTL